MRAEKENGNTTVEEEKKENSNHCAERNEIGENCATVESGYARSRIRLGIGQSMTYLRCLQTGFPRHPPPRLPHSIGATRGNKYSDDPAAGILRSTNEAEMLRCS